MTPQQKIELLKRRINRERLARKQAESVLEQKIVDLENANKKFKKLNKSLEKQVKRRIDQLKESEIQHGEIIDAVSDAIYKTDLKGNYVYANDVTLEITGYSKDELLNKNIYNLIDPNYYEKVNDFYNNQIKNAIQSTNFELPVITKNGEKIWVEQSVDLYYNKVQNKIEFIVLAREITEKRNYELALRRSEEKYRGIIENLELGLLEVDNQGLIVKAYPEFCKMVGYEEEEIIGKNAKSTFFHPKDIEKETQNENRSERHLGVYEVRIKHKLGHYLWGIISRAPYYDETGKVAGSIEIHLDISDRKKLEDDLLEAKEIAENSVKSKELFMANMSHEIRTPMNAIIGMSNLLHKTKLEKQQKDYLEAIKSSSQNLLVLINDILDFSKIEAGKLDLEYIDFDLHKALLQVKQTLELKAEEKEVLLLLNADDRIFSSIKGDPTRLSQVLINLAGNAIKFTAKGEVEIKIKLLDKSANEQTLYFEVRDTGIGISEDKLATIFESFSQANASTTREYGGTGLGLSISKHLVALMNGELEVKSKLGVGSSFYFTITFEKGSSADEQDDTIELKDQQNLDGTNVLLVEDNEINQFMALTILKQWNCKVATAQDGLVAIEKLKNNHYDIVLMDIRMPNLGGVEATQIIRNELKIDTPIIALTANAIKGDREKYINAGMDDYVSKPFNEEDLIAKISSLISTNTTEK